jgi:hypothetical protein
VQYIGALVADLNSNSPYRDWLACRPDAWPRVAREDEKIDAVIVVDEGIGIGVAK